MSSSNRNNWAILDTGFQYENDKDDNRKKILEFFLRATNNTAAPKHFILEACVPQSEGGSKTFDIKELNSKKWRDRHSEAESFKNDVVGVWKTILDKTLENATAETQVI